MTIIQPFSVKDIPALLADKKILLAKNHKMYKSVIFPESTEIQTINKYDKENIITKIDDSFFSDFVILRKTEQVVFYENNTKRDYIKCIEIGDFNDSIKRYTNLDKPIDFNTDSQKFLNLPNVEFDPVVNQTKNIIFPGTSIEAPTSNPGLFSNSLTVKNPVIAKFNDKTTLLEIFKWAKSKGILFIYSIIENRPYVINNQYTTPYVYYTIKGQYSQQK